MKGRSSIFENILMGALVGFVLAWLSSAAPNSIRLGTPAIFSAVTWILLIVIRPWLNRRFQGAASTCKILVFRICICFAGWILLWSALGLLRHTAIPNNIREALSTDDLSLPLLAAFGVTAAVLILLGKIFPLVINIIRETTHV